MTKHLLQKIAEKIGADQHKTCYFCNENNVDILETHHVVPKRHGGTEHEDNLVKLCPSCHRKIETLYDEGTLKRLAGQMDQKKTYKEMLQEEAFS